MLKKLFSRGRREPAIAVSEARGLRMLHIGGEAIQSAMRVADPHSLALDYTRSMMAFLLFHPEPREALMIGLGGGSLAKFFHRRFRATRTRVVECDPRVVTLAREQFLLPPDDARLAVEVGDGTAALAPECCDLLLVDGFDDEAHSPALVSQDFYHATWAALSGPGALVVNFMSDDPKLDTYLKRIECAFEGAVLSMPARYDPNLIVIALKGAPRRFEWKALQRRAQKLEQRFELPFPRYLNALKRMNPHDEVHLELGAGREFRLNLSPAEIAALAALAFAGSVVFGITGFGAALITVPFATHFVSLPFALALYVLMDLANSFRIGFENPRNAVRAEWTRLVPTIVAGTVAGVTLLVNLPRQAATLALGLFVLAFAVYSLVRRPDSRKLLSTRWVYVAGFAGGVTSTLFGAGGPPYAMYLSHRGLTKEQYRATLGLATFTSISLRAVAFLATGILLDPKVWLYAAAIVPAGLLGLWAAGFLFRRISREALMRAVAWMLLASGASLLARALA